MTSYKALNNLYMQLFSFNGKVGRKAYILSWIFIHFTTLILWGLIFLVIDLLTNPLMNIGLVKMILVASLIFLAISIILFFWSSLSFAVRRLNDLGFPRLNILLMFIPLVSLLFFTVLFMVKGLETEQNLEKIEDKLE